jgi:hypothetical protein
MDIAMDPAIAFRVPAQQGPALEVRVNFGVYSGRNATAAEIDDLARTLRAEVKTFAVVAEERHQFGDGMETALHQVVIEVDPQNADGLDEASCNRIVEMANRWAAACIASRSELGELRD